MNQLELRPLVVVKQIVHDVGTNDLRTLIL